MLNGIVLSCCCRRCCSGCPFQNPGSLGRPEQVPFHCSCCLSAQWFFGSSAIICAQNQTSLTSFPQNGNPQTLLIETPTPGQASPVVHRVLPKVTQITRRFVSFWCSDTRGRDIYDVSHTTRNWKSWLSVASCPSALCFRKRVWSFPIGKGLGNRILTEVTFQISPVEVRTQFTARVSHTIRQDQGSS